MSYYFQTKLQDWSDIKVRCMAVKDNTVPAFRRLVEFFIPQNSRGLCRSREKQLFILALGTISFLCFGSIWFLPDKSGPGGKVKVVKDTLKEEFENLILPPPPQDLGGDVNNNVNPNIRHGVIDKPLDDPHKAEERAQGAKRKPRVAGEVSSLESHFTSLFKRIHSLSKSSIFPLS